MNIRIPANKPYFPESDHREIAEEMINILAGGRLTQGLWVKKFEREFAAYTGAQFAVAVNSGTSALEILLRYFEVKNREVIVPTNTFLATANAVIFAGGKPVLADVSPQTLCLDPQEITRRITPATKGVILVHIAGLISPHIEEIRQICMSNGLFLIEDAAHAPGATSAGRKAGTLTDGAAFSFYPTKPLTTGEGGMITTDDPQCAAFAQSLRCHGIAIGRESEGANKNLLLRLGHNWRMSEFQALLGYYQLKRLDEAISRRQQAAAWYERELQDLPGLRLIQRPANVSHAYYKFPVVLDKPHSRQVINELLAKEFGIQCGSIYWPPCHLQPFYRERFGYQPGDFPVAEDVLDRTIALPIYPELKEDEVLQVTKALINILKTEERK